MTIRYILCSFGTFFPVLVTCTKKNLATLELYVVEVRQGFKKLLFSPSVEQGCQMVYLRPKIPIWDIFWGALEWKMLVCFTAVGMI
jgi:hypothetical protein